MDDKVFLNLGDVVLVRLDIPNKPKMIVIGKSNNFFKTEESKPIFRGMECIWFTSNGELQKFVFSTKDLIKI